MYIESQLLSLDGINLDLFIGSAKQGTHLDSTVSFESFRDNSVQGSQKLTSGEFYNLDMQWEYMTYYRSR